MHVRMSAADHDPADESSKLAWHEVEVDVGTTLAQLWAMYKNTGSPLPSGWLSDLPYAALIADDTGLQQFRWLATSSIYRPGSELEWHQPWMVIELVDFPKLYPYPAPLSDPLHIVWGSYPQMGNGDGIPWEYVLEQWQAMQPTISAIADVGGAALVAKVGTDAALAGGRRGATLLRRGIHAVERKFPKWRRGGVEVEDVRAVIDDERLDEEQKATMLGVETAEVSGLRELLDPQVTPSNIYSGVYGNSYSRMPINDPYAPPADLYRCACRKSLCGSLGALTKFRQV